MVVAFAAYEHTMEDTTVALHVIQHGKPTEMHVRPTENLKNRIVIKCASSAKSRPATFHLVNMAMNTFVGLAKSREDAWRILFTPMMNPLRAKKKKK